MKHKPKTAYFNRAAAAPKNKRITKLLIGTPSVGGFPALFVMSLVRTLFAAGNWGIAIEFAVRENTYIHVARNMIANYFIESPNKFDYLLFIDNDMVWEPNAIPTLIRENKDIIGGLYCTRNEHCRPVVFKSGDSPPFLDWMIEIPEEPFLCDAAGTGFLMIKRHVIESLMENKNSFPFDMIDAGKISPGQATSIIGEDLSFGLKAKAAGYSTWCDPRVSLGHIGELVFTQAMFRNKQRLINQVARTRTPGPETPVDKAEQIKGWMSREELEWLYEKAQEVESVVAIGNFVGRSTYVLASGCKGKVYAVDPFVFGGDWSQFVGPEIGYKAGDDFLPDFLKNVGHFPNLVTLRMSSVEAAKNGQVPAKVDMTFLDGDHAEKALTEDLVAWGARTRFLLCGHDLDDPLYPGVRAALQAAFGADRIQRGPGSIWFIQ